MTQPNQIRIHRGQGGAGRSRIFSLRSRWIRCLLALAVGSRGLAGCRAGSGADKGADANGKAGGATPASTTETTVAVSPVVLRAMTASISITGALTAEKDVIVGAKNAGKVADVYVRE